MNKKIVLGGALLIGLVVLIGLGLQERGKKAPLSEGVTAPAFEVTDPASGKKLDLSAFRGKVIFINFWATWCPPCREELPAIDSLFKELAFDPGFAMVTILYNDSPETAKEMLRSMGLTIPVYSDAGGISARNYELTGVPETYLVDKKGILRKRVIGALDWSSPEAKSFVTSLLKE